MSGCPACGRPLALARATCLYCGAALPEASVGAALQAREALPRGPAAAAPVERLLLGLRLEDAAAATLATALGLSHYEARRLAARGGDHLWRLLPSTEAEAEALRLTQAGLETWTLPESQVRALVPRRAAGGRRDGAALYLRLADDADGAGPTARSHARPGVARPEARLAPADLLLMVQGPIAREAAGLAGRRLIGMASPQTGYRFHLHRREDLEPIEVDPDDFEVGDAGWLGSTLLLLREWLGALAGRQALDDDFRLVTPALAPAEPEQGRASRWAHTLSRTAPAERSQEERARLDNLAQFRFYSAWKALLARRRA